MNRRRRECCKCSRFIAFRVWARWDGGTGPPAAALSGLMGLANKSCSELVCADHIKFYEDGWSHMSGLPAGSVVVGHEPASPPPPLPKGHNVRPVWSRWMDDFEHLSFHPEFGAWLECESYSPESYIGRKVSVRIPPEQIVPLMNRLKAMAIEMRSQPMSDTSDTKENTSA